MSQPVDSRPPEISLSFRRELVPHVFKALHGGWSCALVGVRGVGMSNVLRFVCEPRVVASQLAGGARHLFVYLESGPLAEPRALYEAIIRRISVSARAFGWPRADLAALRNLAGRLALERDGEASRVEEILADIVAHLCRDRQCRLVFVFDEFDRTFVELPALGLRHLRGLRDDHKYLLSYVVGTRSELDVLVQRRRQGETDAAKFAELFHEHTFPVRPYARQDTLDAISRKTFDWGQAPGAEHRDRLYRATGGHAKLIVAGLPAWLKRRHLPWPDIEVGLCDDPALAEVCRGIWDDLDESEQAALEMLDAGQRSEIDRDDLEQLRLKGIVIGRPDSIFSSMFEAFIRRRRATGVPGLPDPKHLSAISRPLNRRLRAFSKLRDPDVAAA